jgi:MFS family permease
MQTMVVPALPVLQRELNTTTTWVTWVLTAFLLVGAVATPILGKLGDQFGKERLLAISRCSYSSSAASGARSRGTSGR